jgi:hypothetical protein
MLSWQRGIEKSSGSQLKVSGGQQPFSCFKIVRRMNCLFITAGVRKVSVLELVRGGPLAVLVGLLGESSTATPRAR